MTKVFYLTADTLRLIIQKFLLSLSSLCISCLHNPYLLLLWNLWISVFNSAKRGFFLTYSFSQIKLIKMTFVFNQISINAYLFYSYRSKENFKHPKKMLVLNWTFLKGNTILLSHYIRDFDLHLLKPYNQNWFWISFNFSP